MCINSIARPVPTAKRPPARACLRGLHRSIRAVFAVRARGFTGSYRLSKRQVQQLSSDLFGLVISIGMIAKPKRRSAAVLEAPYNELAVAVHSAKAVNIDETSWREERKKASLWTTVTRSFTVFTIARHRSGEVAQTLLGSGPEQVVGGDRFNSYAWIASRWRQISWAHLRRDFQAMIERGGMANRSASGC